MKISLFFSRVLYNMEMWRVTGSHWRCDQNKICEFPIASNWFILYMEVLHNTHICQMGFRKACAVQIIHTVHTVHFCHSGGIEALTQFLRKKEKKKKSQKLLAQVR